MDVEQNAPRKASFELRPKVGHFIPNISDVDLTHDYEIQKSTSNISRSSNKSSNKNLSQKDTSFKNGCLRSLTNFYRQNLKWIVLGAVLLITLLFIVMIYLYHYTTLLVIFSKYNQPGVHIDSKEEDSNNPIFHGNATTSPVMIANQLM